MQLRFTQELTLHLKLLGSISLGIALLQVGHGVLYRNAGDFQVIGVILTSCLFSRLHRLDKYSPGE